MKKDIKLTAVLMLALMFITAAVLGGCGQKSKEITVEKRSPEYSWVLKTPDEHGVVQVRIILSDAAKKPLKGKLLKGQVWMPEMPMYGYPQVLEFKEVEAGQYSVLVTYAHGGYWQIKAGFENDKGQIVEEAFDFELKK